MVIALIGAGGYVWADVNDRVPGFLTNSPEIPDPQPFPTLSLPVADPELQEIGVELSGKAQNAQSIQKLVDEFVEDDQILGKRIAVHVSDAVTGTTLGSNLSARKVVPASVQKLLTAAVALEQLDHDQRLRTRVVLSGDNTLYLAGEGDMLLGAGKGNPKSTNGYAGLEDLAAQVVSKLKLDGTESVKLHFDGSAFTGSKTGPWESNVVSMGWAAPVSTMGINVARTTDEEYAPRHTNPELETAKVFAQLLEARGISVKGSITPKTFRAPGAALTAEPGEVLGEILSAPMVDVVAHFLQTSDNTITEVVGRTIARDRKIPASFDGSVTAVTQGLRDLGVDTTDISLVDCSGLGEKSVVTAESIDQVLALMVSGQNTELTVGATSLPVGFLNGTLNDRFELRNGRGLVRAKTGSLTGVTSLAGTVVTLDQRLLTFVIIADKVEPGGQWGARKEMDSFVEKLAECGCN